MTSSAQNIAQQILDLQDQVEALSRAGQIRFSTLPVADGRGQVLVPTLIGEGVAAGAAIPGLEADVDRAVGLADGASEAAAAASELADAAAAAAQDAAGLAGSKGVVLFQPTAPTGAQAVPENLWINTTNGINTPNRYDVDQGAWVPVTDKAATDAAAAAAAAQSDAAAAKSAADAAKKAADDAAAAASTAQATANGKNTVTYRATAPTSDTPGTTVGDIWFVRSTTTGIVTGQYEWTGPTNGWQQRTLGSAVIANLDAGKITTGQLSADRIDVNSFTGKIITGATIRTAAAGRRTETTSVGLAFYNANDAISSRIEPDFQNTRLRLGLPSADNPGGGGDYLVTIGPKASAQTPSATVAIASSQDAAFNNVWTNSIRGMDGTDLLTGITGDVTLGALYQPIAVAISLKVVKVAGRVRIDGGVENKGTVTFTTNMTYTLGNIPAGFRPSAQVISLMRFGVAAGAFVVLPNGDLLFSTPNGGTYGPAGAPMGFVAEWPAA